MMGGDQLFVTVIYLAISVLGFLFWRSVIRYFSRAHFRAIWFLMSLAGVLLWGTLQYGVSKSGSIVFFTQPLDFLVSNDWVRWIAFISVLLQMAYIPSKQPYKR